MSLIGSMQRVEVHGEVFTPRSLAEQMLDLATADTPAKMLTAVDDMVELLAKAIPDKNAPPGGVKPPTAGSGRGRRGRVGRGLGFKSTEFDYIIEAGGRRVRPLL